METKRIGEMEMHPKMAECAALFRPTLWTILRMQMAEDLAFDSGEYTRVGEEDKDPSEMYTRPAIATIISQDETKMVLEAFGVLLDR